MSQKVASVPSKAWIFVPTTAIAVVLLGSWLTTTSCGCRADFLNFTNKNDDKDKSCLLELSDGHWELATNGCSRPRRGILNSCNNIHTEYPREWVWSRSNAAASCIPRSLYYQDVAKTFQKKRIALVGDSHLRKLYGYLGSFLEGMNGVPQGFAFCVSTGEFAAVKNLIFIGISTTLFNPSTQTDTPLIADEDIISAPTYDQKAHKDFVWKVKKTKTSIEFFWRANVITATQLLNEWLDGEEAPDLLVMNPSAHQAKWARNFTEFKSEVPGLVNAITRYKKKFGPKHAMFWIISPPFKEPFARDENTTWIYSLKKFNSVLIDAGFMAPEGPVVPIDLFSMAQGCMDWCYRDKTHVVETFNTLLWQQLTGAYKHILSMQP